MKTTIETKQLITYVLPACLMGLLLAIVQPLFALIGTIQFFVGIIQLIIALFKTIYCFIKMGSVPQTLKNYWLLVFVYFIVMAIGGLLLKEFISTNSVFATIALFYLGLAWGIAIYHFKRILFL